MFNHNFKGIPYGTKISPEEVRAKRWNVLKGDLPFPLMILKESALEHNLRGMAAWCAEQGFLLAPHGKTTMCPQIFERQLAHGAWAITVASISQAHVCLSFNVKRILIANQVIGSSNLRSLAAAMNGNPETEFYCLIDSPEGVRRLATGLEQFGAQHPVNVLIEWGHPGWRTGVRTVEQGKAVYHEAVNHSRFLKVCGFEGFEGLASSPLGVDAEAEIAGEFLEGLRRFAGSLELKGEDQLPILSFGGSAFLDCVQQLAQSVAQQFRVIVRSGCYVTHDHGTYERKHSAALARGGASSKIPEFRPAFELWSYVQSIPEPDRALLTFGKRDCSFDIGLPLPLFSLGDGVEIGSALTFSHSQIINLNDQHAHLELRGEEKLNIGDMVCCGISHPCTAFDKWRMIPLVDDNYDVLDLYYTFF
ncbi:MAG: amino acid deaminase [Acidobacteria bacterium]|nr:amino acid deaminase [Acidobacteriota bacterium]